jgi:hypothetical protein
MPSPVTRAGDTPRKQPTVCTVGIQEKKREIYLAGRAPARAVMRLCGAG